MAGSVRGMAGPVCCGRVGVCRRVGGRARSTARHRRPGRHSAGWRRVRGGVAGWRGGRQVKHIDRHGRSVESARAGESVLLGLAPVAAADLETIRPAARPSRLSESPIRVAYPSLDRMTRKYCRPRKRRVPVRLPRPPAVTGSGRGKSKQSGPRGLPVRADRRRGVSRTCGLRVKRRSGAAAADVPGCRGTIIQTQAGFFYEPVLRHRSASRERGARQGAGMRWRRAPDLGSEALPRLARRDAGGAQGGA